MRARRNTASTQCSTFWPIRIAAWMAASFFEALYGHLLLSGNAYVERLQSGGGTSELHLLRPDRVRIVADDNGWPIALAYGVGAQKRTIALTMAARCISSCFTRSTIIMALPRSKRR